ncbi:hypothetical protein [Lacticaseibacillus paracasei]|uniref:hypothetical protein n=1 Tax=Lacticaseibacillus paracasei TaxID=1597 RepID=UPI0003891CC6|nr:hypothetical protein [Lacticaseibacillus paracasei]TDG87812.1 hypothetical protein C5L26_002756 [Lacticaseibacillus paracasei subsp. paracasei]BAN71726.1 conserved hypothetical protein [Lacticaseibacillus paracasei subsp. paracasei]GEL31095.1 hypothetical protein LPA04_15560 [Lacticaseibacillus paracasei subsp. paracasei]
MVDIFIWLVSHQITLAALCFATLAGIFIGALIQFLEDNKKLPRTPMRSSNQNRYPKLNIRNNHPRQWVIILIV